MADADSRAEAGARLRGDRPGVPRQDRLYYRFSGVRQSTVPARARAVHSDGYWQPHPGHGAFLFGEATTLYCRTQKVHRDIRGEDVATVVMAMGGRATVTCNMAYAENHLENDRFPETYVFVEGEKGSARLGPDYWVRVTTAEGTHSKRHPPPRYAWADPAYDVVQASIVPCCADLLAHLRDEKVAETTGEDNLKTVRLVFGAYESAGRDCVVRFDHEQQ